MIGAWRKIPNFHARRNDERLGVMCVRTKSVTLPSASSRNVYDGNP